MKTEIENKPDFSVFRSLLCMWIIKRFAYTRAHQCSHFYIIYNNIYNQGMRKEDEYK